MPPTQNQSHTKSNSTSKPKSPNNNPTTLRLLQRSHSPTTARSIHTDKIQHKPLQLHTLSASGVSSLTPTRNEREARRAVRNARLDSQHRRRRKKTRPLSAAEKRKLCIYDIPKEERKYEIYIGLWRLWCGYMREILLGWPMEDDDEDRAKIEVDSGKKDDAEKDKAKMKTRRYVDPQQAGAKLAGADFHGAKFEVVRSGCVSRVGVKGIVVRDTMFTFVVITEANEVKTLPKEGTVFRFEVPLVDDVEPAQGDSEKGLGEDAEGPQWFVFEIHGEHFKFRAPDRANKKFRWHVSKDYT